MTINQRIEISTGALKRRMRALSLSEILLLITVCVGILHHTDHVLRVDHSGWPFIPKVTTFTWSLLVYPALLYVFLTPFWPWFRVGMTTVAYLFAQISHIVVETPFDQYNTWAYGSSFTSQPTLFIRHSPLMGAVSVTISLLLSVMLLLTIAGFVRDALRARKRQKSHE